MLRHNILLIVRNFKRFKTTFFINLIGLSTGLAGTLLIFLWVSDEWSIDRYHEKDNRLFQVMEHTKNEIGTETKARTQDFLADVLASEMPEIENAITVTPPFFFPAFTLTVNGIHVKGVGKFVGEDFFHMFSYNLLQGNKAQVLDDKNAIVISERMAKRLFPDISNIAGKNLEYDLQTLKRQVTITGVFKDLPANSSEQFDFVLPFDAFRDIMGWKNRTMDWDHVAPFFTYVTLREGTSEDNFDKKLANFLNSKSKNAGHRTLFLKPFSDNYLFGKYENGVATGRIADVRLFSVIAGFILLIACINFMNLSTAKGSRRLKEIGIKKAIGAQRKTLVFQYLAESLLISFLSLGLAILIVDLSLPQFNLITRKNLELTFDVSTITVFLGIASFAGLVAGSYPAFYLSGFNAAKVLKGQLKSSAGELWSRRALVIFQFAVSIIFIGGVLVLYRQIEFVQTKNLGYNTDNVLYFETNGLVAEHPEAALSEIKKIPGVVNASSMLGNIISGRGDSPGGGMGGTHNWKGREVAMNVSQVNYDLIETLGIELAAGRSFSRDHGSDTLQFIYNETAIEALGIKDPVGQILPGGIEIVGIAKDFHFQTLHESIKPHCFMLEPDYAMMMLVKIKSGMEKETIQRLENFYKSFNTGYVFRYRFLDDSYNALYASERRVARLSEYFAGLAIIISCLGLFGLATFTTERRLKEIGIRKVLGSSALGIVYLLSSDFNKIVLAAIVIALPISYVGTQYWLNNFAYRIDLEWWYFAGPGFLALIIAWITVGMQASKAARINPVRCLRDE